MAREVNFCDLKCPNPENNKSFDGYEDTAPVNIFPQGAGPYGALNLAGNVSEWVADWYDPDFYAHSPNSNPVGPPSGKMHILKGGDFGLPRLQSSDRYAVRSRVCIGRCRFSLRLLPGTIIWLLTQ